MTGFEGTIIGGIAILTLVAFLWRALGRQTTINNHNNPQATATAGEVGQGSSRSIIGPLVSIGIIVGAIALAVAAFSLRESSTRTVGSGTSSAPVIVTHSAPQATLAAPVMIDDYVPVALPAVQSGFDFAPLALLAAAALGIFFVSRRMNRVAKLNTFQPAEIKSGLSVPLFDEALKHFQSAGDRETPDAK